MKYYQEITIRPSDELNRNFILSKVYAKLHTGFIDNKDANLGVDFVDYQKCTETRFGCLGNRLRIFSSTQDALVKFDVTTLLHNLRDYVHITQIREVPLKHISGYRVFSRKHMKTNPERLARRRAKKDPSISYDDALKLYEQGIMTSKLPFIQLDSTSTKQRFELFIDCVVVDVGVDGVFTSYGVSKNATVPTFI